MVSKEDKDTELLKTAIADNNTKLSTTTYLSSAKRKHILQTLGMPVYIVFEFYFWKTSVHSFDFNDDFVAKELGLPMRTIKKARQTLIREGLVFQFTYRNTAVKPTKVTLVGEHVVRRHKKNPKSLAQTLARIFKETLLNEPA
jgi:hypothetical protein